jgi:hypothetical protein
LRSGIRLRLTRTILLSGSLVMAASLVLAWQLGHRQAFLPLLSALPAAAYALQADLRKQARNLGVELAALAFFTAFAAAVPAAGGMPMRECHGLWAQGFLSLAPGFAAVRYQLYARRESGGPELRARFWTMHAVLLACLLAGAALALGGQAGMVWCGLQALLYGRAFAPLHRGPAWNLGVLEILADAASFTLIVLHL